MVHCPKSWVKVLTHPNPCALKLVLDHSGLQVGAEYVFWWVEQLP